jgi:hypothetical protein
MGRTKLPTASKPDASGRHRLLPVSTAKRQVSELKRRTGIVNKLMEYCELHETRVVAYFPGKIDVKQRVFTYDGASEATPFSNDFALLSDEEMACALKRDDVKELVSVYMAQVDNDRATKETTCP